MWLIMLYIWINILNKMSSQTCHKNQQSQRFKYEMSNSVRDRIHQSARSNISDLNQMELNSPGVEHHFRRTRWVFVLLVALLHEMRKNLLELGKDVTVDNLCKNQAGHGSSSVVPWNFGSPRFVHSKLQTGCCPSCYYFLFSAKDMDHVLYSVNIFCWYSPA
jgi:hypothetical protein